MQSSIQESGWSKLTTRWRGFLRRRLRRNRSGVPLGAVTIVLVVLVLPAVAAEVIAPHNPVQGNVPDRLSPPVFFGGDWEYPLGTDQFGRDIFTRVVYGARVSLSVSLTGVLVAGAVGTLLGMLAGFFGGWVDTVIMRLVEVTMSIPLVLLGLVIAVAFGPSFRSIIVVITVVLWAFYARQVRGETLSLREATFVDRARVAGASNFRIIVTHILPNLVNTLIVLATLQVAVVIIMEATLSFLGVGLPRPNPSWGIVVADGRTLIVSAWWIAFFPGLAIMLTVLSLNVFGDWLRDRLDPKRKQA